MSDLVDRLCTWARERELVVETSLAGDVAVFSPCMKLRYALTRQLGGAPLVLVGCGLNPSDATAIKPDRTIDKVCEFGRRWGCGLYVMLNAYGWRHKKPAEMWRSRRRGEDIVGPMNDAAIAFVLASAPADAVALGMWGSHVEPDRTAALALISAAVGVSWQCLGTNENGSPTHPLYLPYATPRRPWPEVRA